jgi:tRNA modification GTPase
MVEITCHGNPHIVESILRACLARGARTARRGEFTQRAFLNDKLSLTQAEGLLDLLYAPTERALASARAMKEGKLGRALEEIRRELVDLLSHLEASLDFAEEGIEPRVGPEFVARAEKARGQIEQLLRTAPLGRILHEVEFAQRAVARGPGHCRAHPRHHARFDRGAVPDPGIAFAAGRYGRSA